MFFANEKTSIWQSNKDSVGREGMPVSGLPKGSIRQCKGTRCWPVKYGWQYPEENSVK